MATPPMRARWRKAAELHDGERNHDQHQDHRLRGRSAEIERLHPGLVDLEHQDLRRLAGAALGRGIDNRKCVEKRIDHVYHEQEERRRR